VYANIPKKIRSGKLEVTAVKCRLLGWWVDETKGYILEDIQMRSLITSRDVRFVEDETPTELTIIEGDPPPVPIGELIEINTNDLPQRKPESEPNTPTSPSSNTSQSDFEAEGRFEPESLPPKASKWANLPTREPSTCIRNAPTQFGVQATEDEIDVAANAKNMNANHAFITYTGDPHSYHDALCTPHSKEWEKALEDEYDQLMRTGTFEWLKNVPPGRKTIRSKTVCHEKRDGEGTVYQRKCRIVAKGYSQIPGQGFEATHSAVAKYPTLHALLSIATHENMELHQIDVVGAYLQGDLDEEIYMSPPDGLKVKGKEGWSLRLRKPLYGLKQAGRQWKKK
jgi:hypothetical protein